ncbi:cytochrome C biogenesis protein ResB [Corynebacterium phocae]|uniref:Cytochrome C biogenesis protein ResB n=1 Tax=Corynebacterium phocae TaxID=161895 RepID=A0A1L7D118_9CORY|nr:cytochrome c biogenesis protein ResB [Corynebacterium phocae]APT91835.1 cytochrome C biogenesis protein ResB [Corynebacterium phocae]KAA8727445.1 cytochrome c biogenesis protein ResB [Corynebacterium phocae]
MKYLLKSWRWLTSMRTALALLFLLAAAAIPGSLLPQRQLNETNVREFIAANGRVAEIYDRLQLFDVFSSWWFQAIFMLLTISLIGCIIPRSLDHYRQWRAQPTRAPKFLNKLPHHASASTDRPVEQMQLSARELLSKWRVAEYSGDKDRVGAWSLSAERGYARELANLIFHIGLVAILAFTALSKFLSYEGMVIVVTQSGSYDQAVEVDQSTEFCNTSTSNYDSFRAGAFFDGTGLNPFCFIAHDFTAEYLPSGQAEMFSSRLSYAEGADITTDPSEWKTYDLKVNSPLRLSTDRVYLQGHGYAPTITVEWPNGETRTQTWQFQPTEQITFLSSGAMRFDPPAGMYPDLYERRQHQIALQGLFAPTAAWTGEEGKLLSSSFPAMLDPALAIDIYRGDAGLDTGTAQSIFALDNSLIHSGQLQKIERVNLEQGESITLDDGTKVTFNGASEFANYQISHNPMQLPMLLSALSMLLALVASLVIKRRRVWVRLSPAGTGTLVEMGGLSRTDAAGWGPEFDSLYRQLMELPPAEEVEEDALWVDD